ncbi:carbohydrate ABC transporter permease [Candidatus Uabimicrobium sp. HlEnr_7]|uniref:carbohydrate ABC transporter permease n=1 Tax=Candidatus Uabimicrobium helgolandensis TaxID=3095367 RepID=UPI0035564748
MKKILSKMSFYALISVLIIYTIAPFLWLVISSFKPQQELLSVPPLLPVNPTLDNYRSVFELLPFGQFLLNSAIVATVTTTLCLVIGALGAYALARLNFWWKSLALMSVLSISMFPQIATVTPLFVMIRKSGIFNTYWALIIPYATFALPLTLWILTSFFQKIPQELERAALIDGLSRFEILRKIYIPLAGPALATTGIMVFIACWNEFLFALCFTSSELARTVPVGITLYEGQYHQPWGEVSAASVLVSIPLVCLMFFFQRRILSGLTAGAVKQ